MPQRLSRRKIAAYAADELVAGGKKATAVVQQIAAHLVAERRVHEAELVVRAIEEELERRGIVVATITTAYPLAASLKQSIADMVSADKLYAREIVDPSVIGGLRVQTPTARLDTTIQKNINDLRRSAKQQ